MIRHAAYVAMLTVLLAAPAIAQEPRIDARFTGETRSTLVGIIDSARAAGVPSEPLVQSAMLGATRNIAPPRIIAAVRGLADRMRIARQALGASATEAEIVSGASALQAGVDPATLQRIRRARPEGEVALPLIVLTDIIERGVAKDTAERVIVSLGDARSTDADFQSLRQSILTDIRSGAAPSTAAMTRARGVLAARGIRFPDL